MTNPIDHLNVVIFNVRFSPNLGDGILAECLESELARHLPAAVITTLDLAGRRDRSRKSASGKRIAALTLFPAVPMVLRELAEELLIRIRLALRTHGLWDKALRQADVAIVGGGHLIQDGDLNFPTKLAVLASKCRRYNVPVALYGVGVSDPRSARGAALTSSLWHNCNMIFAGARDPASADRLRHRGVTNVFVTPDPGLLAPNVWGSRPRSERKSLRVGVGITHPTLLRHHSPQFVPSTERALALYRTLLTKLVNAGYEVVCFSNGAHEDDSYLSSVLDSVHFSCNHETLKRAHRCSSPAELAHLIQDLDLIVAHRLHACILAYSYSIPHIGLAWDPKLADFFSYTGRADFLVQFNERTVEHIPTLVERARLAGIEDGKHQEVLQTASSSIRFLASSLEQRLDPSLLRTARSDRQVRDWLRARA
jgi:polysaccharide pyruvyl transferase WcaK-like protein